MMNHLRARGLIISQESANICPSDYTMRTEGSSSLLPEGGMWKTVFSEKGHNNISGSLQKIDILH